MWLSLVERLLWEQDAAGSNPVIRTIKTKRTFVLLVLIFLLDGIRTHRSETVRWTVSATSANTGGYLNFRKAKKQIEPCHPDQSAKVCALCKLWLNLFVGDIFIYGTFH